MFKSRSVGFIIVAACVMVVLILMISLLFATYTSFRSGIDGAVNTQTRELSTQIVYNYENSVNRIIETLGGTRRYFMIMPSAFRHIYVWSGIWQNLGWSAVIYLAALASVDPELHEAATIDGASRLQRIININIPTIMPTIIILLIMRLGHIASVGYEKVYLMRNDLNIEVSEVISTYVYQRGLVGGQFSFTAAIGLFNNLVNVSMLLLANFIAGKVGESSLF